MTKYTYWTCLRSRHVVGHADDASAQHVVKVLDCMKFVFQQVLDMLKLDFSMVKKSLDCMKLYFSRCGLHGFDNPAGVGRN